MIRLTVKAIKVYDDPEFMWGVFHGDILVANSRRWSKEGAESKRRELEARLNGESK